MKPNGERSFARSAKRPYEEPSPTRTSSPGGKKMWCVPKIDTPFVERMKDVLELYARPHDPSEPVVALDERPVVLHDNARPDRPMRRGKPRRIDYEYVRRG